jgi:hypothetical protein
VRTRFISDYENKSRLHSAGNSSSLPWAILLILQYVVPICQDREEIMTTVDLGPVLPFRMNISREVPRDDFAQLIVPIWFRQPLYECHHQAIKH